MLLDELATRLTSTGVALAKAPGSTSTSIAWTIYKSWLPDAPDKSMALIESAGGPPLGNTNVTGPSFMLLVRGASIDEDSSAYSDARAQIEKVKQNLHGMTASTLSPAYYGGLWAENEPHFLGLDDNNRPELACDFRAMRVST